MNHADYALNIKNLESGGLIEGLAAGYGNVDSHREMFAPGAFTKSLKARDRQPVMLMHHKMDRPVGTWKDFTESADGLNVRGQLTLESNDGRDAYALLKSGALTGLSVGFWPKNYAPKGATPAGVEAVITEAELVEVSLVSIPSNPRTHISGVKAAGSVRELEEHLREIGLSSRRAKAAAAAAFRAADDAADEQEAAQIAARLTEKTKAIAKLMGV